MLVYKNGSQSQYSQASDFLLNSMNSRFGKRQPKDRSSEKITNMVKMGKESTTFLILNPLLNQLKQNEFPIKMKVNI